jgi:RHS repeat-associated protein
VSRRLCRSLLALGCLVVAIVATATPAVAQCGQSPVKPPGGGPSAGFLYDPFGTGRAVCVYSVLVTPHSAVGPDWGPNTTGHQAIFTVKNTGTGGSTDTYTLTCSATGNAACTSVNPTSKQLTNGSSAQVTVTYSVGNPGSGTIKLKAQGTQGPGTAADSGTVSVTIGVPIVALAGLRYENQDLARCALSCFQFGQVQSTVPYFSLGAARAVSLVYRGEHNLTQPFIHVDVQQPSGGTLPTKWWLQATLNGAQVTFANGETVLKFAGNVAGQFRLGGQLNRVVGRTTGVYPLNITVTAEFSGGVTTQTVIATKMTIVEDLYSPMGQGWTLGGIQRGYVQSDGSVLVTDGSGSAAYYGAQGGNPPVSFFTPRGQLPYLYPEYSGSTLTGYTRRYPDSTRVWFDATGKMTKAVDPFGNTTQVKYDANGRVDSIIDPMNRSIVLAYDANGFLHTITDPGGRVTTVTVQPNALLTQITDPDTKSTSFGWTNSQLTSITDRRGKVTTVYYNASAQPDSIAAPAVPIFGSGSLRPTTRFKPWQLAGVPYVATSVTPFTPPLTSTVEGLVTEPGGSAVNHLTVDRWGQPLTQTNAIGDITSFVYDTATAQLLKRVLPFYGGAADTMARDTFGLATYARPASLAGRAARRAPYGRVDRLWGATSADSGVPVQRAFIGTNGRVDSVAVDSVVRQRTWYDTRGRVDSTLDAKRQFTARYHYDATTGNVDTVSSPGGVKTSYSYDTFGRATTVRAPGLAAQTTYYGPMNRVDSVKTSDGTSGRTVKYGYDELFQRSVTDPKGQTDSLFYNDIGWLTQQKDAAGLSTLYAYSLDGDLKQVTNRRGQAITYTYDALHRPTQKSGTNTDLVTWTYAATSLRKVTAVDPVSTDTTYLSVTGQPDSVKTVMAGQTFLRRYRYRPNTGQLRSDSISGGGITTWQFRQFKYDSNTAVLTSIQLGSQIVALRSDTNFDVRAATLPPGEVDTMTLGNLSVPLDRKTANATYSSTTDRLLSLDPGYRLQQQFKNVTPAAGRFFTYDSLGQLVSGSDKHWASALPGNCLNVVFGYNCQASGSGWTTDNSTSYGYDLAGNRTSQGGTYGSANRITGFNGCTYGTDADGNVTSRTCTGTPSLTATFTWSAEGLLSTVTNQGVTTTFHYDANKHLVRSDVSGTPSAHYLWDGDNFLAELDGNATTKRAEFAYYPGADDLFAVVQGTTAYFAHADGVGNVLALTDGAKALQRTYTYDDWGNVTGGSDTHGFAGIDRARWKGALWISVAGGDMYYMRNRWFEPQTGRFLSEDPIGLAGGLNRYLYGANDPVEKSDPSGLCSYCRVSINFQGGDGPHPGLDWSDLGGAMADPVPNHNPADAADSSAAIKDWERSPYAGARPSINGGDHIYIYKIHETTALQGCPAHIRLTLERPAGQTIPFFTIDVHNLFFHGLARVWGKMLYAGTVTEYYEGAYMETIPVTGVVTCSPDSNTGSGEFFGETP